MWNFHDRLRVAPIVKQLLSVPSRTLGKRLARSGLAQAAPRVRSKGPLLLCFAHLPGFPGQGPVRGGVADVGWPRCRIDPEHPRLHDTPRLKGGRP